MASAHQRVPDGHPREAAEIAIHGPEFPHPVEAADRGDARVMHLRAGDPPLPEGRPELRPVAFGFREEHQAGCLEPRLDLVQGCGEGRGRGVDSGVSHDSQELVQARPGDGPGGPALGQLRDPRVGGIVPRGVFAVGVDEQVRVEGYQPPRPS